MEKKLQMQIRQVSLYELIKKSMVKWMKNKQTAP